MNIKSKLFLSVITGAIGLSLIGGGTYAYFSDKVEITNQIQTGTLELGISDIEDDEVILEFFNKKPGDTFDYSFKLTNDGTLEIKDVTLFSEYTVNDEDGNLIEDSDFGSQIKVNSLNVNGEELMTETTTLDELEELVIMNDFEVDNEAEINVEFEFRITDDQNQYQGNAMELNWQFHASQTVE